MKPFAFATLLLALAACGGKHPGAYEAAAAGATTAADAAGTDKMAEADALWEQRVDESKLTAAIAAYEGILATDPTNRKAYERATRGWYFYGDAFTDDVPTKLDRWGKAIAHGTKCLSLNAEMTAKIASGEKEKDAVAAATKDDVPCLYWTSTALGKWAKAQGLSTTLKHLPTVKAYMSKVEELDPTYFHYGPARYWGAYYAALPSFAGKDVEKSKSYLQASIDGAPTYLATRVIRAEFYAVEAQDPAQFQADLDFVLAADPNALPEAAAENTKEQEKAKKLLARKADLFLDAGK
jgi:hypothetical protein